MTNKEKIDDVQQDDLIQYYAQVKCHELWKKACVVKHAIM
jgi:hypothetical protein